MTLNATQVWNAARTLRLDSDLPFLYTMAHESGQKWDNLTIEKDCQDVDTEESKLLAAYQSILANSSRMAEGGPESLKQSITNR